MAETNLSIKINGTKSVPIPLLSEEQKADLLSNLTSIEEHFEQLLADRENASLADGIKTNFQYIASTIHSFFDNSDNYTPEMSKLYKNNKTAHFAEMRRLETNRVDYNFKVVSQFVKEIESSLSSSKALAITKVGCYTLKPPLHAVKFAGLFTKLSQVFEKSIDCATELCKQIENINNVYDANTNIVDVVDIANVGLSQISELVANPALLFTGGIPEHEDL